MDVTDVSIPEPQDGELLIRVYPTRDFAFPFVTGMDGAGVVERTCSDNYSREKGDSNEQFKQPARVGCNRTSRKTCCKKPKKEKSKLFGWIAKGSESGRACRSIRSVALYRSR